jgi:hypothetical protein
VGAGRDAIAWDLEFDYHDQRPLFVFPHAWMYTASFPKSKLYTPCPETRFSGYIELAGERWRVERWPGMLGHNWGAAHSPRYQWAQCSLFDGGERAVFEGFSGKIQVGSRLSPWLTGAVVRLRGETLRFNQLHKLFNRGVCVTPGAWSFAVSARARAHDRHGLWTLDWRVSAPRDAFVGLRYVNPDGALHHCLNSKVATCELELARTGRSGRRELIAQLRGTRSCAYEVLTRRFDHGIPVLA